MTRTTHYTIYAVARENLTFTSEQGIAYLHAATEDAARREARRLVAEQECHPTRITEQRREYPFTTTRIVWRCDDS